MREVSGKINMLMNIDDYFGEGQSRLAPFLIYAGTIIVPTLIYIFLLWPKVPIVYFLIFIVLFAIRMGFFILGDENRRLEEYLADRRDVYSSANELVRITELHDDGLIEYQGGKVAYMIRCSIGSIFNDDYFSAKFSDFIGRLGGYEYDIYTQNVIDPFRLSDSGENLKVYEDREMLKERMDFYELQDKYCLENSKLYEIVLVVKAPAYDWKNLTTLVGSLVKSEFASIFKEIRICNKDDVSEIISRDVCGFIDLQSMIQDKFTNNDFYGSKILYCGDEVPEKFQPKKEIVDEEDRRVVQEVHIDE